MERRGSSKGWRRRPAPGAWMPWAVAVLATAAVLVTAPPDVAGAGARSVFADGQPRIMAPAAPGGGWGQTSREMQAALGSDV